MYNSEHEELVHELTAIAIEEMQHFQMVIDIIKARGYTLGKERKDDYVGQLMKFNKKMVHVIWRLSIVYYLPL